MILLSIIESHTQAAERLIERWARTADREYAAHKKNPGAAHNSLLARALLRRLLGDGDFEIMAAENGKPLIKNGPHISVSHSKEMVAAAVCAEFALGIDIEFHRERDFSKLANYAFGPGESAQVEKQGAAAFYRIWTLREAIAKITGESMFRGMNGEDVDLDTWRVLYYDEFKNYSLSLAGGKAAAESGYRIKIIDIYQDF